MSLITNEEMVEIGLDNPVFVHDGSHNIDEQADNVEHDKIDVIITDSTKQNNHNHISVIEMQDFQPTQDTFANNIATTPSSIHRSTSQDNCTKRANNTERTDVGINMSDHVDSPNSHGFLKRNGFRGEKLYIDDSKKDSDRNPKHYCWLGVSLIVGVLLLLVILVASGTIASKPKLKTSPLHFWSFSNVKLFDSSTVVIESDKYHIIEKEVNKIFDDIFRPRSRLDLHLKVKFISYRTKGNIIYGDFIIAYKMNGWKLSKIVDEMRSTISNYTAEAKNPPVDFKKAKIRNVSINCPINNLTLCMEDTLSCNRVNSDDEMNLARCLSADETTTLYTNDTNLSTNTPFNIINTTDTTIQLSAVTTPSDINILTSSLSDNFYRTSATTENILTRTDFESFSDNTTEPVLHLNRSSINKSSNVNKTILDMHHGISNNSTIASDPSTISPFVTINSLENLSTISNDVNSTTVSSSSNISTTPIIYEISSTTEKLTKFHTNIATEPSVQISTSTIISSTQLDNVDRYSSIGTSINEHYNTIGSSTVSTLLQDMNSSTNIDLNSDYAISTESSLSNIALNNSNKVENATNVVSDNMITIPLVNIGPINDTRLKNSSIADKQSMSENSNTHPDVFTPSSEEFVTETNIFA